MKHRLVSAVFAKKRDVLAEIHILEVIGDKTAIASLNALSELVQNLSFDLLAHFTTPLFELSIKLASWSTSGQPVISSRIRCSAWVVFSRADNKM